MEKIEWLMKGRYLKNCNCIPACPCDTVGIPSPHKGCEGMAGMVIDQGDFGGVALDGLSWVAVGRWPGALHDGNGEASLFIDERATEDQRNALLTILSGKAGNAWFEFLASTFSTFNEPRFRADRIRVRQEDPTRASRSGGRAGNRVRPVGPAQHRAGASRHDSDA